MQAKWRTYWYYTFTKGVKSFLIWTPIIGTFFFLLYVFEAKSWDEVRREALSAYMYSGVISICICATSSIMWALATAKGSDVIERMRGAIFIHFFYSIAGVAIGCYVANELLVYFFQFKSSSWTSYGRSVGFGAFISAAFVYFYAFKETEQSLKAVTAASAEAKLKVLESQMHPHFLFNSLNTLNELIETDQILATKISGKLADLYRNILSSSKKPTVALSNELDIVRDYLEIEAVRFGDRLKFTIDVQLEHDPEVPSLLLQTLVENAVKHGIAKLIAGGTVELKVSRVIGQDFKVEILNDGVFAPRLDNTGTGVKNSIERLTLLYGDSHDFSIGTFNDIKTRVQFFIRRTELA